MTLSAESAEKASIFEARASSRASIFEAKAPSRASIFVVMASSRLASILPDATTVEDEVEDTSRVHEDVNNICSVELASILVEAACSDVSNCWDEDVAEDSVMRELVDLLTMLTEDTCCRLLSSTTDDDVVMSDDSDNFAVC
jgi:hypothetical protein